MISKRKIKELAKTMFKQSLKDGVVDPKNVRSVLRATVSKRPPNLSLILKIYKRLIEAAISKEEVILETASPITKSKQLLAEIVKKTGGKRIIHKVNPDIVFGAKITHGDWIYDATLENRLNQLKVK